MPQARARRQIRMTTSATTTGPTRRRPHLQPRCARAFGFVIATAATNNETHKHCSIAGVAARVLPPSHVRQMARHVSSRRHIVPPSAVPQPVLLCCRAPGLGGWAVRALASRCRTTCCESSWGWFSGAANLLVCANLLAKHLAPLDGIWALPICMCMVLASSTHGTSSQGLHEICSASFRF